MTEISADLDLEGVLRRFVVGATHLSGAAYGALGVLGNDDTVVELVTTGVEREDGDATAGLEVPVVIRGTVFGTLFLARKGGGAPFGDEDVALVQALATAAGSVIENALAYGLSERRREWLEAAAALTEILQPPIDVDRARQQIAMAARSVSRSLTAAVVGLSDESGAEVLALDGSVHHLGPDVLRAIAAELPHEVGGIGTLDLEIGGQAVVLVPLRAHLAERAALVAVYDVGHRSDDVEERELLASFADQAALALDRAHALDERQELALVSDRERIARDLHDVVIQRLFATGLQLQSLRATLTQPAAVARIEAMVGDLDQTIREIRGTIFELRSRTQDPVSAGRSPL